MRNLYNNAKVWVIFIALFTVLVVIAFVSRDFVICKKVSFNELPGWGKQDFKSLAKSFSRNCEHVNSFYQAQELDSRFGSLEQWQGFCSKLNQVHSKKEIKELFETLDVLSVSYLFEDNSLFTGYYAPTLNGSLTKSEKYKYPLYKTPKNLVSVNLSTFFPDNKDFQFKKLFARIDTEDQTLYPYYSRAELESDNVMSEDDVIVWVDSKIDLFFLQIQGSGQVKLEDGSIIHVGYDTQNGHSYKSIGTHFIREGIMRREDVSLDSIKSYLLNHKDQQDLILNQNPSYIFFSKQEDGPYGAFGLSLEPKTSVAVDRTYIPLGTPLFISTTTTADNRDFNKMVFAHDVGGAIKGPVRADIYFGGDKNAEIYAGEQKSTGKIYVFSAKNL